jgi:hypothetical protein
MHKREGSATNRGKGERFQSFDQVLKRVRTEVNESDEL